MTLGDVTDDSDGHHQPPGKESLPGEISRIDQPNPGDEDEVADLDQMTANIANYEKLLATETDPKKIAIMRNYWQKKKPNCPTGALKMKNRTRQNEIARVGGLTRSTCGYRTCIRTSGLFCRFGAQASCEPSAAERRI